MPIMPGTSPLSFLLSRRGVGPAVAPGQMPGTATPSVPGVSGPPPGESGPPGSGPNPILQALIARAGQIQSGGGMPGGIFNRTLSRRLEADPQYLKAILKQMKLAVAHLIPYAAQTQGTDVSKDLANIYRMVDTSIDRVEKASDAGPNRPIGFAGAQGSGGMNANITPVNSLPVSQGLPTP